MEQPSDEVSVGLPIDIAVKAYQKNFKKGGEP
jgi:hypothetical protein